MRCWGNMRCDILTDFPFCKYAKLRSIQWVSRGLSVRCWFVKAVYVTCAGVELKATGVTASAIEIEPGRKMSWRKRKGPACAGPSLLKHIMLFMAGSLRDRTG